MDPPYQGPFPVINHGEKTITEDICGKRVTVSIDWIKLAQLPPLSGSALTTHSGCIFHAPPRFS